MYSTTAVTVVDVLINRKVTYLVTFYYGDENLLTSHQTDFYNHALKIMSVRKWSLTDSFTDSVKTVLEENLILQIYWPFFFYHDTTEMQELSTCNVNQKLMSHTDARYITFIAVQS